MDILKNITDQISEHITEANFEGANIVLYTDNENFFREGEGKIKEIVSQIKKRIELRADQKILPDQEKTAAKIAINEAIKKVALKPILSSSIPPMAAPLNEPEKKHARNMAMPLVLFFCVVLSVIYP